MNRSRGYVGSAVVVIGFALTACGAEVPPTSGASDATPSVAPTVPRGAVPAAPATAAFEERARAVAEVVRAAGIPKPPEGIFLHSSRTPDLAFDTTEQKLAWSAGKVVVAPGVRLGSGGTSRIDFADGSSVPVSVVDARPALTGEIGFTQSNCRGIPASSCTLTITAASLGTAEVVTSRGPATVPAWSFTAKRLSRKIVVVAVSKDVLKTPAMPVPPPGLDDPAPGLLHAEILARVEGSTLTFFLNHGDCDGNLRAHVLEFDDLVVVGGSHDQPPAGTACTAALRRSAAVVALAAPLGDRAVISASTGIRLFPNPQIK
ncbi:MULTISPECIES: hypothetical protein [unclassified Kribbella]|uniref:hypothetical protein n=1 Tax=unclassified Kribbella TaxID=2644121 RepID=UPI003016194E